MQIEAQQHEFSQVYARQPSEPEEDPHRSFRAEAEAKLEERRRAMEVAALIADRHLHLLQKRDLKDLARAAQVTVAEAHEGVEFIRTLDPRPGRQYNREQTRLIEPDVVFIKRGGEWVVSMNEEDLPSLRLSRRYRRMLVAEGTDKEVKDYVKERFRSAMQLMRNIAQRKSTILRTCEVIVRRQQDFLDLGIEALRPMMIKEVAEEIGVHPSTVSRAVANKYAHTPQGVIELRFFFSEGSNGPEGADTPLLVLKRKVRKLIEEEDAGHPLTDDQLAAMLDAQGIRLTRRTVAKYREDLNIPSTHQRRRRDG
jgi:RNA polymerase sigma-54 factor